MQLFARITKVDEATRRVFGVAASEEVDHANESLDYAGSKPYFDDWSSGVQKATGGASVGNLRVMHGNVVAGKIVDLAGDDVSKSFPITAEVVDDNEWNKVMKGCYTGFSIGGSYVSKTKDATTGVTRYVAKPNEISLVDLPCNPGATFTVSKADGVEELRKFEPTTSGEALRKWLGALPDDVRADLTKAVAEVSVTPPAPAVDEHEPGRVAVAKGLHKNLDTAAPYIDALRALLGQPVMAKGMYDVQCLTDVVRSLGWITEDAQWELDCEQDGSKVPEQLRAALKTLAGILIAMAKEEVQEFTDAILAEKSASTNGLRKGADSPTETTPMSEDLKKSLDTATADLTLAKAMNVHLTKALDDANKSIADRDALIVEATKELEKRAALIKSWETAPEPANVSLTAISKSADGLVEPVKEGDVVKKADGTVDESLTAIRKALSNPL